MSFFFNYNDTEHQDDYKQYKDDVKKIINTLNTQQCVMIVIEYNIFVYLHILLCSQNWNIILLLN